MWSLVAEKVQAAGGRIHYNQKVHEIILENGRITAVKTSGQDKPFACDTVLSTMPVRDLVCAINPAGQVPEPVYKAAAALPYRDFITVGLLLKRLKLVNKTNLKTLQNIVPDCWIYIQERDVRIGRLQLFNNWSPYMVKDVENTIWIGLEYFCTEGDNLWNLSSEDCIQFAIGELVKINIIDKEDVLDATHVKIEKAYPAYFGTYSEMDSIQNYLNTIPNLYCLGRNGQHKYNNMDHSMLTAMRAVELIKAGGGDKSTVWNVNAEKEYHEEKKDHT